MEYRFTPKGVCSKEFCFDMEGTRIKGLTVTGGCPGNLIGIGRMLEGKEADEIIESFRGVRCGERRTSCPEQIAFALEEYLKEK